MINPGEWKIYALDQWIEDSENKLIHQDKMMELIPPSLIPAQLPMKNYETIKMPLKIHRVLKKNVYNYYFVQLYI